MHLRKVTWIQWPGWPPGNTIFQDVIQARDDYFQVISNHCIDHVG